MEHHATYFMDKESLKKGSQVIKSKWYHVMCIDCLLNFSTVHDVT